MPDSAKIVSDYIASLSQPGSEQYLFLNKKQEQLTRSGIEFIIAKYASMANNGDNRLSCDKVSPHIFRHSKAMHLVQAGVNIVYIRDLLGHVSVQTTEVYARADSDAKRKALENASKNIVPDTKFPQTEKEELLDWLKNLV